MMHTNMHKTEDISDEATYIYWNQSKSVPTDANIRSDVQLSLKSFFYTWAVNSFSKCLKFCAPKFYSPEFIFENIVWRLRLYITEEDGVKKISIRLVRQEKRKINFFIKMKVNLLDEEGKVLSVNEVESSFRGDTCTSGLVSLMLGDTKSLVLFNDKLIVHCEFLVLASNARDDDASTSLDMASNFCDSKLASAVPVLKKTSSIPRYIISRLNEKVIYNYKEGILLILLVFLSLQYVFVANEIAGKYEEIHNKSSFNANYLMKRKEINELIIDSTLKLRNIAEALNLTDVKIKSTDILTTYLRMYNKTMSVALTQIAKTNASESLTSEINMHNSSNAKLQDIGVINNSEKGVDINP